MHMLRVWIFIIILAISLNPEVQYEQLKLTDFGWAPE